jgi:hypothetical protein
MGLAKHVIFQWDSWFSDYEGEVSLKFEVNVFILNEKNSYSGFTSLCKLIISD